MDSDDMDSILKISWTGSYLRGYEQDWSGDIDPTLNIPQIGSYLRGN